MIEILLCYIRHFLIFALDFCFFEKTKRNDVNHAYNISPENIDGETHNTRILQYTKTWTYILREHLYPNEHKAVFTTEYTCQLVWGRTWVLECFISWMFSLRGRQWRHLRGAIDWLLWACLLRTPTHCCALCSLEISVFPCHGWPTRPFALWSETTRCPIMSHNWINLYF